MSEESSAIDRLAGTLAHALSTRVNPESVQAITDDGSNVATSLSTDVTTYQSGGDPITSALAAGIDGQIKSLVYIGNSNGAATVTVTNLLGGTTLTLDTEGDAIVLQYLGAKWTPLINKGVVIA